MAFCWRWLSGVRVDPVVVVVGEVIEGLEGVVQEGVEGDAILGGAVEVLEGMDGRLLVFMR